MIGGAKGIGIGIDFGIPNQYCRATSKTYIEKDVLDSLRVVASAYGKSNNDSDRAIVKNLVDASNPFVISNASFKLNSGFGKYSADFESFDWAVNISQKQHNKATISLNGRLCNHTAIEIDEMKVNIIGNVTELIYWYIANPDDTTRSEIRLTSGINTLPKSYAKDDGQTYNIGFAYISGDSEITIEQIPSFEGAFVTDGINDLITSTKTVQEMLGGSNEITVVSMMANLDSRQILCNSNFSNTNGYNVKNTLEPNGVISMLGYTDKNGTTNNLNLIMGDKDSIKLVDKVNFNSDYVFYPAQYYKTYYQVAWYWTIIANKVLTTDQINQVIAYFNLDRTLKPDILCDVKKQGITNDNHAEFGDKLINFSGNGRDIQLNNIAWKGDSGIGKYNFSNINIIPSNRFEGAVTTNKCHFTKKLTNTTNNFCDLIVISPNEPIKFKVSGLSDGRKLFVANKSGSGSNYNFDNGEHEVSLSFSEGVGQNNPFGVTGDIGDIDVTVEFIPSHAGALCFDGVDDYGKVTGLPIYKDYTVVTDREIFAYIGAISSKNNPGAFMETAGNSVYSFGQGTSGLKFISTRSISYLSKYSYCGQSITAGAAGDGTDMWLGTIRDNDTRFFNGTIYSLMSFPYSMSEFLIERQLKKHKLGTLYPDMVEFRPIVKSNVKWNIIEIWQGDKSLYRPAVNDDKTGIYLKKDSTIGIYVKPKDADEVTKIVVNGTEYTNLKINSNGFYYVALPITKSPQKINITIDEYIRYEDIVQPYPSFVKLENLDRTYTYTWGDKLKVGDTIRYNSSVNLLEGAYTLKGQLECNGVYVYDNNQHITVAKEMIFAWTNNPVWSIDNNEPKCILSPRLLRIPNSSYKILGYIPDISGHNNNGIIHNSAYAEGSGVNEDGSYQFDGVDDFVTIPTVTGGKQVLMKVNWLSDVGAVTLYDQRLNLSDYEFAIYNGTRDLDDNPVMAYQGRNNGQTYIDGILNSNIMASELKAITHNITITNELSLGINNTYPVIGSTRSNTHFAQMSLYDFMLFDEISTDDKIKELNEYVGIEAKVELPPYYWDTYGKTNFDADKTTIQQRGVAIGDYDLTNYNHTYEGMSGYNGYPVVFGANKTWANESNGYVTSITSNTIHITNVLNAGLALLYSYVKYNGNLQNIKEIPPFKIEIKGLEGRSKFIYKYLATSDATKETNLYLENGTHELPKSFLPTEALINNAVVGFSISPIEEGVTNFLSDITIKVLPEYENGLVYDGVTDYSENANIPAFTDYTYICKRTILNIPSNGATLLKGAHKTNGGAFIADYNNKWQFNFGQYNIIQSIPDGINWQTSSSFNGTSINRGTNTDDKGITIGRFSNGYANMVLYKLILYPKTIPLLQINFLKNLMERDEIIDLNNPIFIQ